MTVIEWDSVGERKFQTGVDRGVIYLPGGISAPWNGLTSADMDSNGEVQAHYLAGVKFLERQIPGDFSGTIKAFTYPDEFEQVLGISESPIPGVLFYNQRPKSFNLTYRTLLGNDVHGTDHGYKIHLIYNARANPDAESYGTIDETTKAGEFSWALSAVPEMVDGMRPTAHISVDSTRITPYALEALEALLYGTETSLPTFPPVSELIELMNYEGHIVILDNGDGTWTATGPEELLVMLDSTTFQISDVDASFTDANTYVVQTTTLHS